jgi:glycosyltransferase involved in cell wall biosynthesis
LVDDCSPDSSMALAEQRLKPYTGPVKFEIIHHEINRGLSEARNTGIKAATGDYLYFLDSDDEISPDCIETLASLAEKYPEAEIAHGNMQVIPEPSRELYWQNILYKNFPEYADNNCWVREHFYGDGEHIPINAVNKLIMRKFVVDNNLFFRKGIIHEDELWMFYTVKRLEKIAFSTRYTYIRYINPDSITQSANNYASIRSWNVILKEIFDNMDEPLCRRQRKNYTLILYNNIIRINFNINEEKKLYFAYRDFIKSLLKKNIRNVFFASVLTVLLMPQSFYKSSAGRTIFFGLLKCIQ